MGFPTDLRDRQGGDAAAAGRRRRRDGHRPAPGHAVRPAHRQDRAGRDRRAGRPAEGQVRGGLRGHPDPARRGQDHHHRRPRARPCGTSAGGPRWRSASRRWARRSASRAARPAAATRQVVPMETLNLHLTGDFHAVTAAHNMLSAVLDNHLFQGNACGIDPHNITWRRVLDVNDRVLRNVIVGLGSQDGRRPAADRLRHHRRVRGDGHLRAGPLGAGDARADGPDRGRLHPRRQAGDRRGHRRRRGDGRDHARRDGPEPVADAARTRRCSCTPGPFGNIAHGNSSVVADLIGIRAGDFLITEAGFGADMGAERFFNIKCRASGLRPDAAVVVATVRALKAHSGKHKVVAGKPLPEALLAENPDEVHAGGANLRKQIENIRLHGVSPVVAINAFPGDHPSEHEAIRRDRRVDGRPGRRCARTSPTAAPGPPSWPRRWPRRPRSPRTSGSSTPTRRRCGRRSRRWRGRCTAPTGSTTTCRPAGRSTPTSATGSATCRCASPRPTCPSRPTRR